jgi:DNA-binding CsgD family transcriptional regulator
MGVPNCLTIDIVENIADASTPDAIWHGVKAIAAAKGFDRILIWRAGATEPVLFTNIAPAEFDGFELPPAIEARPYTLGEFPCAGHLRRTPDPADGFVVPASVAGGIAGAIAFVGAKPEMDGVTRSTLHVIAQCAIENLVRLESMPHAVSSPLSPREIECLRWAAAGKSDTEIGLMLLVSARTTRFHLENAKRKLGVATRAQAISEAMRRNLLIAQWLN